MSPACVPKCVAFEECPDCFFGGSDKERERVAALEKFVRDFRRMVDEEAIVPKVITVGFARLCADAVALTKQGGRNQ